MKLTKVNSVILKVLPLAIILPVLTMAQVLPGGVTPPVGVVTNYTGVTGIIKTITNWMFGILLLAAVVFLIYAAFLYLTSGGDEEKTKKAKGFVIYAVIAIAIGILAQSIVALVFSLLGQGYTPQ